MAAQEHSAGLVLYRQAEQRLYLLLDYGRHWDYPKGHIEANETPLAAALRELKEETGITDAAVCDGFAEQITYFFRGGKSGLIRKTVIFYLARTHSDRVSLSHEHVGFTFAVYEQALRQLTFASARQILRKAEEFLLTSPAAPVAAPAGSPCDPPAPR